MLRRYYLEVVGRKRLKISRAWEMDGYRMAEAKYYADENPASTTPEGAQLAQLATSVEALADQWVDKVKCVTLCPISAVLSLRVRLAATSSGRLQLLAHALPFDGASHKCKCGGEPFCKM